MADVARRQSYVEWMGGSSKATGLCWPTGERRFMQMRMAATLPSSDSWAARLAMFSAAPSSRLCTMLVARLREPGGRPAGFPLWPFRNWDILLTPLLVLGFGGAAARTRLRLRPRRWGLKKPGRFWGAP